MIAANKVFLENKIKIFENFLKLLFVSKSKFTNVVLCRGARTLRITTFSIIIYKI